MFSSLHFMSPIDFSFYSMPRCQSRSRQSSVRQDFSGFPRTKRVSRAHSSGSRTVERRRPKHRDSISLSSQLSQERGTHICVVRVPRLAPIPYVEYTIPFLIPWLCPSRFEISHFPFSHPGHKRIPLWYCRKEVSIVGVGRRSIIKIRSRFYIVNIKM